MGIIAYVFGGIGLFLLLRGKAFTAMMVDICVCILAVCELIVNMLSRLA